LLGLQNILKGGGLALELATIGEKIPETSEKTNQENKSESAKRCSLWKKRPNRVIIPSSQSSLDSNPKIKKPAEHGLLEGY